jgi:hypothetical protein
VIGSAAPGYSSGQAVAALEEVAKETLPQEMGYDWADLSYQEKKASGIERRNRRIPHSQVQMSRSRFTWCLYLHNLFTDLNNIVNK